MAMAHTRGTKGVRVKQQHGLRLFFKIPISRVFVSVAFFMASSRSKRVDDNSRFYANFRDFRGARVSTLTPHVLKPNADPLWISLWVPLLGLMKMLKGTCP